MQAPEHIRDAAQILKELPLRKLSRRQTFTLSCLVALLVPTLAALTADLSPYAWATKPAIFLSYFGLVVRVALSCR